MTRLHLRRLSLSRIQTLIAAVAIIALLGVVATIAFAASRADAEVPQASSQSPVIAAATSLEPAPSAAVSGPAVTAAGSIDATAAAASATSATSAASTGPVAPTPARTTSPTARPTSGSTPAPTPPPSSRVVTVLAAGDVRSNTDGIMATTRLIESMPGPLVLNVGDDSANGTAAEYADYFNPAWGQFKSRIYPTPGNHEYNTAGAAPYFAYYGARAGNPGQGWYSFDFSGTSWHVIELNGNVAHGAGSTQETWLRRDLAANAGKHIIAFWHQPRFSSGTEHGSDPSYTAFWNDLYAARADIVLNGHDHDYERFALQNGAGQADPQGIREFVVGMGGTTERQFGGSFVANSQAHNDNCWGVLKLTLRAASYDWGFVPVPGCSFHDAGTQATHS